jgi:hypothetical protein
MLMEFKNQFLFEYHKHPDNSLALTHDLPHKKYLFCNAVVSDNIEQSLQHLAPLQKSLQFKLLAAAFV